jgi:hypothetical protein
MNLAFSTRTLRDQCMVPALHNSSWSREVITSLRARLADLSAADTLADVPLDGPDELRTTRFEIPLADGYSLKCEILQAPVTRDENSLVRLEAVHRIKITAVVSDA